MARGFNAGDDRKFRNAIVRSTPRQAMRIHK
jgi:hypothetical protein